MEFQVTSYTIALNKQMMLEVDASDAEKKKTKMAFVGEWEIVCYGKKDTRSIGQKLTIIGIKPEVAVPDQLYTSQSVAMVFVNSALYNGFKDMICSGQAVYAVVNKNEPSYLRIKETAVGSPVL